ncbi:hypothetical protein [Endozoicomonas ascidiicola]|uniref:hypothetical protein n=1 Tax=Endozoicomonas ascidiicola TaxID=1698521 RepID=UPI00083734D0|nr:hypothetical protein [Endozoicomonas ascidiicola]
MSISCDPNQRQFLSANQSMDLMLLTSGRRKRVLKKTATEVRRRSRQNLGRQKTVDGQPMAGRKTGKGRMFRKLGKTMQATATTKQGKVSWANAITAKIAYRHQHGVAETFNKEKMDRRYGEPDYNAPATRKQGKALLESGYRLYAGKKKGRTKTKKPSQRWIIENMTIGHAGYLIRQLRDEKAKRSWTVRTPARPFLGVTEKDGTRILAENITAEWERQAN